MNYGRTESATPDRPLEVNSAAPLLILGASTRAAAYSAWRAGYRPLCGDMFADADLRAVAEVVPIPDYPRNLVQATANVPPCPWIYTGALENAPTAVGRLADERQLRGNGQVVLLHIRDPFFWTNILQQAGCPTLGLRRGTDPPAADGYWMRKPHRSAAGREISVWTPDLAELPELHYFQQRSEGRPISGLFLSDRHHVCLLGVAGQLIGDPALHAPRFGYCGSIVPFPVSPAVWQAIEQIGRALHQAGELTGLWGVDALLEGETPFVTEINPRYTASVELWEHWWQIPWLHWHMAACTAEESGSSNWFDELQPLLADAQRRQQETPTYFGKVILYADRDATAPNLQELLPESISLQDIPVWADIPVAGTPMISGQPVMTALGSGADAVALRQHLTARIADCWEQRFI